MDTNLSVGLSNLYQLISELKPRIDVQVDLIDRLDDLHHKVDDYGRVLESIHNGLTKIEDVPKLITQTLELGLVGVYQNRLEAIEHAFYSVM